MIEIDSASLANAVSMLLFVWSLAGGLAAIALATFAAAEWLQRNDWI